METDELHETMDLRVQVRDGLILDLGKAVVQSDEYVLTPPETPVFDQLWGWLAEHPCEYDGLHHYALGIGATALCFRWGTYLSLLMDENKPIDPLTADISNSMVLDSEIKRINIEASYNLGRLFEKMDTDDHQATNFMLRAYKWLPMPQRRVVANRYARNRVYDALLTWDDRKSSDEKLNFDRFEQLYSVPVTQHPYRILANAVTMLAYRNGEVEDVHMNYGSCTSGISYLTHRRFTKKQSASILRKTAENLRSFVVARPFWSPSLDGISDPWPERLIGLPATFIHNYFTEWSLTETSALVTLPKV